MPFAYRQRSHLSDFVFPAFFPVNNQLCISSFAKEKSRKNVREPGKEYSNTCRSILKNDLAEQPQMKGLSQFFGFLVYFVQTFQWHLDFWRARPGNMRTVAHTLVWKTMPFAHRQRSNLSDFVSSPLSSQQSTVIKQFCSRKNPKKLCWRF